MVAQRRAGALGPVLFVVGGCITVSHIASRAFVAVPSSRMRAPTVAAKAFGGLGNLGGMMDTKAMEELMKDPEKMKQLQAEAEKIMQDPEKKKMLDQFSSQMEGVVKKLEQDQDPEMQAFFKDIKANGMDAMKNYENNPNILRKFSEAHGGPGSGGMPGMGGMPSSAGGAAPMAPTAFKPGDEVVVHGLAKAPELNGKKAMLVPPTAEERKTLEGTDRLIVRLIDTGDQFAVKPANLRTMEQEASKAISSNLEDVSIYNPALQTEAAKLRDSGKLDSLSSDPELKPIFEDIKKNGMAALEKYWNDDALMRKINAAMSQAR